MNSLQKPSLKHWARIDESTFVLGIRLLFWICKTFGRWPFRLFLYPVIVWYVATKPVARQSSRNYLQKLSSFRNEKSGQPGFREVFRHFFAFGESILDKILIWSGHYSFDKVILYGNEPLNDYIDQGKGCLLICSHLGNLELCKAMSRLKPDLKVTMLVHTRHAEAFNQLLNEYSTESQLNLMQVTEISPATVLVLMDKIRNGEFIIIAGDRVPVTSETRTVTASFLGQKAPFPVGPYVLASLLQCPVYLMFPIQRHSVAEIHFELFRESIQLPRKNREALLIELANDFARRLEQYCLMAPLQWFNFYPFWQMTYETK